MTEAIRIQKDAPTTKLFSNPRVSQNWSQRIRASPQLPIKSQTSKRKHFEQFSNHQIVNDAPGGELAVEYLYSVCIRNNPVFSVKLNCYLSVFSLISSL